MGVDEEDDEGTEACLGHRGAVRCISHPGPSNLHAIAQVLLSVLDAPSAEAVAASAGAVVAAEAVVVAVEFAEAVAFAAGVAVVAGFAGVVAGVAVPVAAALIALIAVVAVVAVVVRLSYIFLPLISAGLLEAHLLEIL